MAEPKTMIFPTAEDETARSRRKRNLPDWDSERDYYEDPYSVDEIIALSWEIARFRKQANLVPKEFVDALRESYSIVGMGGHQQLLLLTEAVLALFRHEKETLAAPAGERNDAKRARYFELLEELDNALNELVREIRTINNPKTLDARMRSALAHFDSLRPFLTDDEALRPDEVPMTRVKETAEYAERVDWMRLSEHAQKWANTVLRAIENLLKLGG
ncbi:MAG: hypothetical protein AAFQ58_22935 [Pseudomonadota bacterium]